MFEFLFNYSPEVYARGQLIFASNWPFWAYSGTLLILASIIVGQLKRKRHSLSPIRIAVTGLLQLAMLAIALLLAWQPSLLLERLRPGDNVIAVMLDTSASMSYGTEQLSRIDEAKNIVAGSEFTQLQRDYQFRRYVFADDATAVDDYGELPPPGAATNLGDSILKVLRQAGTTSLGAIILLSDGADNNGAIRQAQLAEISSYGVPIHSIGLGREQIPEDVELSDVVLPEKALPNSTLAAQLNIRHDAGGEVRVKVYDGDEFLAAKTVPLAANESTTMAWLDFNVSGTGHRDLRFSLDPLPQERNLLNNAQTRVVSIPETSYRVLYVEGEPRWEYKFMRRAVDADKSIKLVTLLQVSPNKYYRQGIDDPAELSEGFPSDTAELYRFHALIIGSINAASFTPEQQQLLHDFVSERGGSLLLLAGPNGMGNGGWGNTSIGEVLPAALPETHDAFHRTPVPVRLTLMGRQSPMLKFSDDSSDNDKIWRELPDLADYQTIGALRPAAVTLLEYTVADQQQPLLVTQPYGRGHSYLLATGGTWRWQMSLPVADQRHETFWRQLLRGLVANTPDSFELSGTIRGNKLVIRADVRDDHFKPLNDISVAAVVTQPGTETVTLKLLPDPDRAGSFQGELQPQQPGLLAVEAISSRGDEPLKTARMSIYNETGNAEYFSLRQNRALLQQLADSSGGKYWTANQLQYLPDAIQLSRAGITEQDIRPLWDAPAIFLLLILLKSIEWGLRRRWRSI